MQLAATREGGKKRCSGRSRLAEINTGFSRASRSPALRRLAKLAPLASARKQHSADRSRACELTMYALSERTDAACMWGGSDSRSGELPRWEAAARATLRIAESNLRKTTANNAIQRIAKPQNDKNRRQTTANEQRFSFKPPRHYTASGLLNLLTTLAQAVARTTPGTPTAFRGKPYGRTNYRR